MSFKRCNELHAVFDTLEAAPLSLREVYAQAAQVSTTMLPDLLREALEYLEDPISHDEGELCVRDHCDENGNDELWSLIEKLEQISIKIGQLTEQIKERL